MAILRYPINNVAISTQNGFVDLHDWLGFLCAKRYLHEVLVKIHGLTATAAERRAKAIVPHVRVARDYIEQSLQGPKELAFLPAYYAILNLSKVYVLLGPRHADLPTQRWHGATYDPNRNVRQSLLTDVVKVKSGGVFPLFHETLTGRASINRTIELPINEILPCMSGISHEYVLATGKQTRICSLQFGLHSVPPNQHVSATVFVPSTDPASQVPTTSKCLVPCLSAFRHPKGAAPSVFVATVFNPGADLQTEVRKQAKTYLLLRQQMQNRSVTLLGPTRIEFPEEIPIWLLFFYMSSVVRYNPEFFSRLKDSKYWPPLSSATRHAFLDFLLAFWSFVHKTNYFIVAP
jgi:YaaC-like Protein